MNSSLPSVFVACCLGALGSVSGSYAVEPDARDGVAYFEEHIRPLLAKRCYECHSARADSREGGLLLDSQSGWSVGGDQGPAVIPGDVNASLLIQAVRYESSHLQMPPDRPLSSAEVAKLEHWIRLGAPDPRDAATADALVAGQRPSDPIAGREHWAYRPLSGAQLPRVQAAAWPRAPIDSFVLARLESAQLRPAPDADRHVLARRVYFQLTGLPPTPAELTAFLADGRPDAYARLVDDLLHRFQFGETWARHWLDLARYADSNGLDENFLFREAWRYRNWVIEATNADVPYDRFLLEQIAGDVLPFDSITQRDRQRIAAGFLVVGPKVLLGGDGQLRRMEVADEQIDTIGRAILAQTLGCARCHDHKFDPIPMTDYYSLAGIFTSTHVTERRYMLGQQRRMERLVGLGPDGNRLDEAYEKYWRERPGLKERKDQAKSALELLRKDDADSLAKLIEKHTDAVDQEAQDMTRTSAQRVAAQERLIAELDRVIDNPPKIPPRAMIPQDSEQPADESIRLAGQFDRIGDRVPRGFLQVVHDGDGNQIRDNSSGRLELGQWVTDTRHGAGRLTARVMANRIWHHLMGRGIVRTVDNFGRTGEPPSHPQLLDYLARRLIESDWSIKAVVREVVLSHAFAVSSHHDHAADSIDPDNKLLWRAHRRRLTPEAIRDAMLAAAQQLDLAPMNSTVWYLGDQATAVGANEVRRRTDFPCRSVYLPIIRNDLPELFQVFDFADPHSTTGARSRTTVATQGLFMLNDETVMDAADAMARRVLNESAGDDVARIDFLFSWMLNTRATDEERHEILEFVRTTEDRLREESVTDPTFKAWSVACHAMFSLSRFQFLE